jgi:glucokinase
MFPYPVLLCDVGGTNCRFSEVRDAGAGPRQLESVATDAFPSFEETVRDIKKSHSITPASMIICAAGPLQGRYIQLTNASWDIDGPELARRLGLQQGLLLNDFEALALSLPIIKPDWTRDIGNVRPAPGRPQVVLGPGTGLGTAALVRAGGKVLGLETEAGHTNFAATTSDETAIWSALSTVHRRITPETILCGNGLIRLHAARVACASGTAYREPDMNEAAAAIITGNALADTASEEAKTVRLFWRLIARYAGDITLTYFAQGGVTLAGGILPRIEPLLDEAEFRQQFEDKEPMREVVEAAPVRLLMRPDAAHFGMAAIAAHPDKYLLDYAARCWR